MEFVVSLFDVFIVQIADNIFVAKFSIHSLRDDNFSSDCCGCLLSTNSQSHPTILCSTFYSNINRFNVNGQSKTGTQSAKKRETENELAERKPQTTKAVKIAIQPITSVNAT